MRVIGLTMVKVRVVDESSTIADKHALDFL